MFDTQLSTPKPAAAVLPALLPPQQGADSGSLAKDSAKDMHEGFKAVAAPLLQMLFVGANLSRGGHEHEHRMSSIKLPPKPEQNSLTGYSPDQFRRDREILLAAIGRQQSLTAASQDVKKQTPMELPQRT